VTAAQVHHWIGVRLECLAAAIEVTLAVSIR
jgi:hypothetical protein